MTFDIKKFFEKKNMQLFYVLNILFIYLCFVFERKILDAFYLWIISFVFYLFTTYLYKKTRSISYKFTLIFLTVCIMLTLPGYTNGTILELLYFFLNISLILLILFTLVKIYDYKLEENLSIFKIKKINNNEKPNLYFLYLIFIIIILLIVNYWMFQNKIGITGIPSTKLFFKLTGILSIFFKYVIPIVLFYFFLKIKNKSFFLITILFAYGIYLGTSTASRSASVLITAGPVFYYYNNKKWFLFIYTVILSAIMFEFITLSREYTYATSYLYDLIKNENINLFYIMINTFNNLDISNIFKYPYYVFDRLLGIESLLFGYKSSVAIDLNYFETWKMTIGLSYTDYYTNFLNLLNFEQTGRVHKGGTTNLNMNFFYLTLISSKNSFFGTFLFCLTYLIFTSILDLGTLNIKRKYNLKKNYVNFFLIILMIIFLINPQYFANKFLFIFILVLFFYISPEVIQIKKLFKFFKIGY